MRRFYDGKIPKGQFNAELYSKTSDYLFGGFKQHFGNFTADNQAYINVVRSNIFGFSGAKNMSMFKQFAEMTLNPDGSRKPWKKFRDEALALDADYNKNWLRTEYDNVVSSGVMGDKWQSIQETAELYPYLKYTTERDSHVRPEHAAMDGIVLPVNHPFWDNHYPPNGWNCRCDVEQLAEMDVEEGEDRVSTEEEYTNASRAAKVPKDFQRNVGKTGVVFDANHPYYGNMPQGQLKAEEHYGLPSPDKMPRGPLAKQTTPEQFNQWLADKLADRAELAITGADGLTVARITKTNAKQAIGKLRADFGTELENVIRNADEVWSNQLPGERYAQDFFITYLKWFEDVVIFARVEPDGTLAQYGTATNANLYRVGQLLKR